MNEKMRMGWLLLGFGTSLSPLLSAWYVVVASSIVASFYLVLSARYVVVASLYFYRRLYWRRAPRGPHPSSDLISGTSSEVLCTSGAFVGPRRRWYDAPWERGIAHLNAHNCLHMGHIKGHARLQMGRIAE